MKLKRKYKASKQSFCGFELLFNVSEITKFGIESGISLYNLKMSSDECDVDTTLHTFIVVVSDSNIGKRHYADYLCIDKLPEPLFLDNN